MKAPEYYYLMVTKDEFELPLAVADSFAELSKNMRMSRRQYQDHHLQMGARRRKAKAIQESKESRRNIQKSQEGKLNGKDSNQN